MTLSDEKAQALFKDMNELFALYGVEPIIRSEITFKLLDGESPDTTEAHEPIEEPSEEANS